eukprot:TRINITY_DN16764_c0_g2_i1.p1 TRINITY_DN16764_c0_g2~~TRINITY_DN16764_c0_g2_i1.p1  ORF type:complete len:170 (+),score=15.07 TRINITY_DN16764_c0_g2_i1:341-850(+)
MALPHGDQAEHDGHGVSTHIDGTGISAPVSGTLGLRWVPAPLLLNKEEPEEKNEGVDHIPTIAPQVPMGIASSTMAASRLAAAIGGVAGEAAPSHGTRPIVARPLASSSSRARVASAAGQVFRAARPAGPTALRIVRELWPRPISRLWRRRRRPREATVARIIREIRLG